MVPPAYSPAAGRKGLDAVLCVCDILLQEMVDSFQAHTAVGGRKGPYQSKLFCSVVFLKHRKGCFR